MSAPLKLIIFDVDGTLVDSQHHVQSSMETAFAAVGLQPPALHDTRQTIGLSLTDAMQQIRPDLTPEMHQELARECEIAFLGLSGDEETTAPAPLFDGVIDLLGRLSEIDNYLLGIATGKSRIGLDRMLKDYDLEKVFLTKQVADDHPSKPNPAMIITAIADIGVDVADTVMIGDTTFDIEMGLNAKVKTIGVSWGYHENAMLMAAGADYLVHDTTALEQTIYQMWD